MKTGKNQIIENHSEKHPSKPSSKTSSKTSRENSWTHFKRNQSISWKGSYALVRDRFGADGKFPQYSVPTELAKPQALHSEPLGTGHYKSYSCSRCNSKKFSVLADLKTHEKHCGRDKWLCSCGTTFSRKDKLFGHVTLFQGHTPALSVDDNKASGTSDQTRSREELVGMGSIGYNSSLIGNSLDDTDVLDTKCVDDMHGYFSPMNFDACNFEVLDDFVRPDDAAGFSFSFLPSGSGDMVQKNGENA